MNADLMSTAVSMSVCIQCMWGSKWTLGKYVYTHTLWTLRLKFRNNFSTLLWTSHVCVRLYCVLVCGKYLVCVLGTFINTSG